MNKKEQPEEIKDESTEDDMDKKNIEIIEELQKYKKNFEPRWYMATAFWEGIHFFAGKKNEAGEFKRVKTPHGKVIREIPKAKKQMSNIRNMILKPKQMPVVYPDVNAIKVAVSDKQLIQKEIEEAKMQGRVVRDVMEEGIRVFRHAKKLIRYGQMYGIAYLQLINDEEGRRLKVLDPFEVSMYPDGRRDVIVRHFHTTIDKMKKSDLYDQTVIEDMEGKDDGNYSSSEYKNAILSEKYGTAPTGSIQIDEVYKIVSVPEEVDKEGNVVTEASKKLEIYSYYNEKQIRKEEHIKSDLTKIPIVPFYWGDEPYQTSILEDMMHINKAYDIVLSKLEETVKKLATGRMLVQKGEDSKVYTTKDGEIIRYKRIKPTIMETPQISSSYMVLMERLDADLKEQGVSIGSPATLPSGVKAWRAIEELKESDYSSIGTQLDNFNDTLVDITEVVTESLALESEDGISMPLDLENGEPTGEIIKYRGTNAQEVRETGRAEGEKSAVEDDTVVIRTSRRTKVQIESGMAYTETAKKDMIMELMQMQVIPPEVAIEELAIGNTQDIMEKVREASVQGKSLIDAPDFQMLPTDLQKAIAQFLSEGATQQNPSLTQNPEPAQQPLPPQ